MIYEYTHTQNHTCVLIIKKQIFGLDKLMDEVFGDERFAFKKYVETEFKNFEKIVLGHDCYFILYDCNNDEDPFENYVRDVLMGSSKYMDEDYDTEFDKAADRVQEQLASLEENGLVCMTF